ncbi:MAG: hypothetical protein P4L50_04610 [Anaerolineaceae bacterium]|nr:hypothetical protein [Anaerolineaceae bacterium]
MDKTRHIQILQDALGDGKTLSPKALEWITSANLAMDLDQLSSERHFDNIDNRQKLCILWQKGFNTYMQKALALSAPKADTDLTPKNRQRALSAFGQASHALADFYAHTNWVELHLALGDTETLAPLFGTECRPQDFPEGLQSGYFNIVHGLKGCPHKDGVFQPPHGFEHCHETLNKDRPDKGHGAELSAPGGPSYNEIAMHLAVLATQKLWAVFHERLLTHYGLETGEILFRALAWGKDTA